MIRMLKSFVQISWPWQYIYMAPGNCLDGGKRGGLWYSLHKYFSYAKQKNLNSSFHWCTKREHILCDFSEKKNVAWEILFLIWGLNWKQKEKSVRSMREQLSLRLGKLTEQVTFPSESCQSDSRCSSGELLTSWSTYPGMFFYLVNWYCMSLCNLFPQVLFSNEIYRF